VIERLIGRLTHWAAAVCLVLTILVHVTFAHVPPSRQTAGVPDLYFRSGAAVKRLALSYDALLADLYWMRALQYFGKTRLDPGRDKRYDELYPLLDITTTLDPRFTIAYRFGAVFLAETYPDGPGRPDLAISLLEKGVAADPGRWQYLQDIGFVHYWWLHDYQSAGRWFERASRVPGAPEWLAPLAGVTLTKGGNRADARRLWQHLLDSAEHEYVRRIAQYRLTQLGVLDELDRLNAQLDRVRADSGRGVTSWAPLAARGWISAIPPRDPAGVPYALDSTTGRADLSIWSPYYPLPVDPEDGSSQQGERP